MMVTGSDDMYNYCIRLITWGPLPDGVPEAEPEAVNLLTVNLTLDGVHQVHVGDGSQVHERPTELLTVGLRLKY